MRNVRRSPDRPSSATTYHSPRSLNTRRGVIVRVVNSSRDGVQYSTIFKDTRKLAAQAVEATKALMSGEEPEANDTETYDNGVKIVPSYLLESDIIYEDNIQELLLDSGYWTQAEVDSGVAE